MQKIIKFTSLILILSCILSAFVSCKDKSNENEEKTDTSITFKDSTETEIVLKEKPKKVAVLFSSYVDVWQMSGNTVSITVGDSVKRGFVEEKDVVLVDSGSGHSTINSETLIAEKPDLIIGTTDYSVQVKMADEMRKIGIPTALFKVESHTDYLAMLKIFCEINGEESVFEEVNAQINTMIESQIGRGKAFLADKTKKDLLFIRAGSSNKSTKAKRASDHFACKMLEDFGLENIADEKTVLLDGLSLEEIIDSNPYYIFVTFMGNEESARANMEKLLASDGYRDLDAVKNERVFYLEKDLFHYKPNARWGEAYQKLADYIINA